DPAKHRLCVHGRSILAYRARAARVVIPDRVRNARRDGHLFAASQRIFDSRHPASQRPLDYFYTLFLLGVDVVVRRRRRCPCDVFETEQRTGRFLGGHEHDHAIAWYLTLLKLNRHEPPPSAKAAVADAGDEFSIRVVRTRVTLLTVPCQ